MASELPAVLADAVPEPRCAGTDANEDGWRLKENAADCPPRRERLRRLCQLRPPEPEDSQPRRVVARSRKRRCDAAVRQVQPRGSRDSQGCRVGRKVSAEVPERRTAQARVPQASSRAAKIRTGRVWFANGGSVAFDNLQRVSMHPTAREANRAPRILPATVAYLAGLPPGQDRA